MSDHSSDKKSKIVSFRLSASQYQRIDDICRKAGYESVAWLARLALLRFEPAVSRLSFYELEIESLRHRLDLLSETLRRDGSSLEQSVMDPDFGAGREQAL